MSGSLLSISHVRKAFDGVYALRDVTFDVAAGECVALVGENGAGKSTLMKILSGVWPFGQYEGAVSFDGKPLKLSNPLQGRCSGISIIHQELCLFPKLTVAENLFLTESYPYDGTPSQALFSRVHWQSMETRAAKLFEELGFDVDVTKQIEDLSVAQRQLVEIARAFHHNARLLILDEPTSALSRAEVQHLFTVIERMRERNMSFIYISHKLDEVFRLADRIVVLRDGQAVAQLDPKAVTPADVIRHMVGRPVTEAELLPEAGRVGEVLLEVRNLSLIESNGKKILDDISLSLRRGEVLGIAGLMGSSRSELLRAILGILPGTRSGEVLLEGKPVVWESIEDAMQAGVAFVPEDRKKDGLFLDLPIRFNLSISSLRSFLKRGRMLDLGEESKLTAQYARKLNVKMKNAEDPVRILSGGNQQKVLLAKVLARSPKVLLLDEPTRGIDVGAKEEIYEIVRSLAQQGIAVLLVSSELPEILALTDRAIVLREGRKVGELQNRNLTQEMIMTFAAGEKNVH